MMKRDEVQALATLSRLSLTDDELDGLAADIEQILAYVSDLRSDAPAPEPECISGVSNALREDGAPHAPGKYSDELVDALPSSDERYAKVKQIISHE